MHIDETGAFPISEIEQQIESQPSNKKSIGKTISIIVAIVVIAALTTFLSYWLSPKTVEYELSSTYEAYDGLLQTDASTDTSKVSYEYDANDTSTASAEEYRAHIHYSFLFAFQCNDELPTNTLISESIGKYGTNVNTDNVEDNPVKIIVHLPEEARASIEAMHNAIR